MNGTPEVLHDPPPEALLGAVGNGTVDIELRFWSGARQLETREAQHAVIREALRAFKAQSVATGSDAYVIEPGKRLEELLQLLTARKDAS
jgi:small-conductance mechanosensitive channel